MCGSRLSSGEVRGSRHCHKVACPSSEGELLNKRVRSVTLLRTSRLTRLMVELSGKWSISVHRRLSGKPEYPLTDDVPLDLAGPS